MTPFDRSRNTRCHLSLAVLLALSPAPLAFAQASPASSPQSAASRQSGTVKAATPHDFVLTTTAGQDLPVTVPENARVLLVPPGSKDLSAAQPGTPADIAAGDRVIVSGTPGDPALMMNATRVIVMKSSAIAARSAADQAAWARGVGGIVRSVDASTGIITVASGLRTFTVDTTPKTIVRRYSGASVRFEDAVRSEVASIQAGDQLRARGQRSPDGTTVVADEIVTGSFSNFSGVLTAVDPTAGTVTLKDLASKREVTVSLSQETNLRRLPPGAMQAVAARRSGDEEAAHNGGHAASAAANTGDPAGGDRSSAASVTGGAGGGRGGASMDLSRMMNRLPTQAVADLKTGDAVMIVASNGSGSSRPTAAARPEA